MSYRSIWYVLVLFFNLSLLSLFLFCSVHPKSNVCFVFYGPDEDLWPLKYVSILIWFSHWNKGFLINHFPPWHIFLEFLDCLYFIIFFPVFQKYYTHSSSTPEDLEQPGFFCLFKYSSFVCVCVCVCMCVHVCVCMCVCLPLFGFRHKSLCGLLGQLANQRACFVCP